MRGEGLNGRYSIPQQEFDTFNANSSKNKPEGNQQRLGQAITQNLQLNSYRSQNKDKYSSMLLNNHSYEEMSRPDTNLSFPLHSSKLCHTTDGAESKPSSLTMFEFNSFEIDFPSWATGVQPIQLVSQGPADNNEIMHQILSKLNQMERRMNNTDEKIRISGQLSELKYTEKQLSSTLGKEMDDMGFRRGFRGFLRVFEGSDGFFRV